MKLKVTVTKDHIKKSMWCGLGNPSKHPISKNCAISKAIIDILPDAQVNLGHIYVINKYDIEYCRINLPVEANMFISKFDQFMEDPGKRLELPELEFEIEIPTELIDSINIDNIHNSKNIELVV